MIIYKDILKKLKSAGYTTNAIRSEKLLTESTMQRIRHNKPITTATINKLCELTGLQPADLIEYRKDGAENDKSGEA